MEKPKSNFPKITKKVPGEPCPYCKKTIDMDAIEKDYHPKGRIGKCPKCNKQILFTRQAKNLVKGENGNLVKRFKRT